MKALIYKELNVLEMGEIPAPDGPFVVDVIACGICGTDLKAYLHGHRAFTPPTVLGHEMIGRVARAPMETGYLPGDIVAVAPYGECGVCNLCRMGAGELCRQKPYFLKGAFAQQVKVPPGFVDKGVVKLPEPDAAYTLCEPLACVLCGMEKCDIKPNSRGLIVGGGPMGVLFALVLQHCGNDVVIVEPVAERRGFAEAIGVPAVAPGEADISSFDRVVIAVNRADLVDEYVMNVADKGIVHIFSGLAKGEKLTIDAAAIHYREVAVTGSSGFALPHFHAAYEMLRANPAHFRQLITHEFPLEQGQEAFDLMKRGQALKILLRP